MNLLLATDSYKLTHWNQYPAGTERVFSYFESRHGATWDTTVFFGLQGMLSELEGQVITHEMVAQAEDLASAHFGSDLFNSKGWTRLIEKHGGRLPLRIRAVPEGTVVPVGNVLMTVENTDDEFPWLTNYFESFLTHVWYPSTVASLSYDVKRMMLHYLQRTGCDPAGVDFMLHDFGYRGAASHESAAIGGAGHLLSFKGTDTLPAMEFLMEHYGASLDDLAFSVPATEHSVMTAEGEGGEMQIVDRLLDEHPTGILSIVADSYDIYSFVDRVIRRMKDKVLAREGRLVIRPDSITPDHQTPHDLVLDLLDRLWAGFGGTRTQKGYKVLDDHVRLLWSDGINPPGIEIILDEMANNNWAAENMVFGMGGGLLQKVNRDTQRFAFKCSAQKRNGEWVDVQKRPLDESKSSKAGRLKLIQDENGDFSTVTLDQPGDDLLVTVFEDGARHNYVDFTQARANASG